MEFVNFSIDDQYIGLTWNTSEYADLHNNFDFQELRYNPTEAKLELEWRKSSGMWTQQVKWQELKLVFEGVDYFAIRQRDADMPTSENTAVAHLCRIHPDSREDFDNIYFHADVQSAYDLLILFESEWAIKVNAATVSLLAT